MTRVASGILGMLAVVISTVQAGGVLVWENGDTLPGEIQAASAGAITWASPAFEEAVTLDRGVLRAIVSEAGSDPGHLPFLVELSDGSRLFGEVTEVDERTLTLESPSVDRIEIPRSRVRRVRRMRGATLAWAGPYGKLGWQDAGGEPIAGRASWVENPASGALRFLQVGQAAELVLDVPDRLECQVTMKAPSQPRFAASLRVGDRELQLETWGETVVLRTSATRFVPLATLKAGQQQVSLRIFWDAHAGRGLVASRQGDILERFGKIEPAETPAAEGFGLQARCPDLELSEIEFWNWDGEDPEGPRDPGGPAFESAGVKTVAGVGRGVQLADTGRFRGELVGVDGPFALFRTAFAEEALRVRQADLRRLDFKDGRSPEKEREDPEGSRLAVGDYGLAGEWVPSETGDLLWRLEGGRTPAKLSLDGGNQPFRLDRSTAGLDPLESGTLAYFRNGEIAPGQLRAMREAGNEFRFEGPRFGRDRFDQAWLQGVVFDSRVVTSEPDGGQWVKLGKGEVTFTDEEFTIEKGSALGHPALSLAGRLRIQLPDAAQRKQLGLRVRLFCRGLDPETASLVIAFRNYRNRIYVGVEKKGGITIFSRVVTLGKGESPAIELDWSGSPTIVRAGGTTIEIPVDPAATHNGVGMILEAGYGRSQPTPITVQRIAVLENPALTSVPFLGPKARDQVLFLPRFRKGREPAHVLVARNGDAIRGTVESFDGKRFTFRSMLESIPIPAERVAGLVRFEETPPALPGGDGCWVVLRNGARFRLENPKFGKEWVLGESALLGECRLPAGEVRLFLNDEPDPNAAAEYLAGFRLRAAPEPDPDGSAGDDDSLSGEEAPEFTIDGLGEGEVRLSDFAGKVVVLSFWASWSEPSLRRIGDLIELVSAFSEDRVQLLAVNQGEPEAIIRQKVEARGWHRLVVGIDRDRETMDTFGVDVLPTSIVIDPEGRITTFAAPGEVTAAMIDEALEPAAKAEDETGSTAPAPGMP